MELLQFTAETYVLLERILRDLEVNLQDSSLTEDRLSNEALSALGLAAFHCTKVHLRVAAIHASELRSEFESHQRLSVADIEALRDSIRRELQTQLFVHIPAASAALFSTPREKWEDVAIRWPNAIDDIEEMNRCWALCRYPAAVFHSLMVVEHGLIDLAPRIGATDPKAGWDATFRRLQEIMAAGYAKNPTTLDFHKLEQLNAALTSMKLAWRNKVSHAIGKPVLMSGGFAPDVTEQIVVATKGFMQRLAELTA